MTTKEDKIVNFDGKGWYGVFWDVTNDKKCVWSKFPVKRWELNISEYQSLNWSKMDHLRITGVMENEKGEFRDDDYDGFMFYSYESEPEEEVNKKAQKWLRELKKEADDSDKDDPFRNVTLHPSVFSRQ